MTDIGVVSDTSAVIVTAATRAVERLLRPDASAQEIAEAVTAVVLRELADLGMEAEENGDEWPTWEDLQILADDIDGGHVLDADEVMLGRPIEDVHLPEFRED